MITSGINLFYQFAGSLGYHHPIHPLFVHVPVGLIVGALLLGLTGALFHGEALVRSAFHCITLCLLFCFPVIIFGLTDWVHFYDAEMLTFIKVKMVLTGILLLLLSGGVIYGFLGGAGSRGMLCVYALCFFTVAATGFFGAELVYGDKRTTRAEAYQAGKVIYEANCAGCHPRGGNAMKPELPVIKSSRLKDLEEFVKSLRHPAPPMPSYRESDISDSQAKDLYLYITNVLCKSSADGA